MLLVMWFGFLIATGIGLSLLGWVGIQAPAAVRGLWATSALVGGAALLVAGILGVVWAEERAHRRQDERFGQPPSC